MTHGLLAPLSPQEGITLRRIAHGSIVVDTQAAARLTSLALVERVHTSLRLTPLGRLRFNALPKAPLLTRPRSAQTATDYVAGIIEKAQGMAKCQPAHPAAAPLVRGASPHPTAELGGDEEEVRFRRLAGSRSILKAAVPVTRASLDTLPDS